MGDSRALYHAGELVALPYKAGTRANLGRSAVSFHVRIDPAEAGVLRQILGWVLVRFSFLNYCVSRVMQAHFALLALVGYKWVAFKHFWRTELVCSV